METSQSQSTSEVIPSNEPNETELTLPEIGSKLHQQIFLSEIITKPLTIEQKAALYNGLTELTADFNTFTSGGLLNLKSLGDLCDAINTIIIKTVYGKRASLASRDNFGKIITNTISNFYANNIVDNPNETARRLEAEILELKPFSLGNELIATIVAEAIRSKRSLDSIANSAPINKYEVQKPKIFSPEVKDGILFGPAMVELTSPNLEFPKQLLILAERCPTDDGLTIETIRTSSKRTGGYFTDNNIRIDIVTSGIAIPGTLVVQDPNTSLWYRLSDLSKARDAITQLDQIKGTQEEILNKAKKEIALARLQITAAVKGERSIKQSGWHVEAKDVLLDAERGASATVSISLHKMVDSNSRFNQEAIGKLDFSWENTTVKAYTPVNRKFWDEELPKPTDQIKCELSLVTAGEQNKQEIYVTESSRSQVEVDKETGVISFTRYGTDPAGRKVEQLVSVSPFHAETIPGVTQETLAAARTEFLRIGAGDAVDKTINFINSGKIPTITELMKYLEWSDNLEIASIVDILRFASTYPGNLTWQLHTEYSNGSNDELVPNEFSRGYSRGSGGTEKIVLRSENGAILNLGSYVDEREYLNEYFGEILLNTNFSHTDIIQQSLNSLNRIAQNHIKIKLPHRPYEIRGHFRQDPDMVDFIEKQPLKLLISRFLQNYSNSK